MPAIIICETKKTPRIKQFISECNQIMKVKGFFLVSRIDIPSLFFYNMNPGIQLSEIHSTVKMIKAIPNYSQVISNIKYTHSLRNG